MQDATIIRNKFQVLSPLLNERVRRLWAAAEALALGRGGVTCVATATRMSRTTIRAGIEELHRVGQPLVAKGPPLRMRRPGAGRKPLTYHDPRLLEDLEALMTPVHRGELNSPLRWTCKSTRQLAQELNRRGRSVNPRLLSLLLNQLRYLQAHPRTQEGAGHPDRPAQLEYINARAQACWQLGQPVVWVEIKQMDMQGKMPGRERPLQLPPELLPVLHFQNSVPGSGRTLTSVAIDGNTAGLVGEILQRWWCQLGRPLYPRATELLIVANCCLKNNFGDSWKETIHRFAHATRLGISFCHFPPAICKWNTIEPSLFGHITQKRPAGSFVCHQVAVNLVPRPPVSADADCNRDLTANGFDENLVNARLAKARSHGEWNFLEYPLN